eukprot:c5985_g1_i2.p1 GENE.c5985_g1_i2~~c5985_g1_i2.p1  ORF type:complete len:127 (+),score=35.47 c5985_g1_i2:28-381(+)
MEQQSQARQQTQPDPHTSTTELFGTLCKIVETETDIALEDYKALEEMNSLASTRFSDMRRQAVDVKESFTTLRAKHNHLQRYLDEIDTLDTNVQELEKLTKHLDDYTKQLESKFKNL